MIRRLKKLVAGLKKPPAPKHQTERTRTLMGIYLNQANQAGPATPNRERHNGRFAQTRQRPNG